MSHIRFQADSDLHQAIVDGLVRRDPQIVFRSAVEANLEGKPDQEVLGIAADDNMILVSHDRRTMPREFGRFAMVKNLPGVIIVPQNLPIKDAIEDLFLIWSISIPEEWSNRILVLPI